MPLKYPHEFVLPHGPVAAIHSPMRYVFITVFLSLAWTSVYAVPKVANSKSILVVDDRGRQHRFAQPPKRVVSMSPAQTELIFHLGQGFRLVGRTENCDYPQAAKSVPSLGHTFPPSYEKIIALKPDVVLMMSGSLSIRNRLEKLGIPVIVSQPKTVDDVASHMQRFGRLFGVENAGRRAAQHFREKLTSIKNGNKTKPLKVFYEVWARPLTTTGPDTFLADVIRIAGAENLVRTAGDDWPKVSRETVVFENPDAVLVSSPIRQSAWLGTQGPWSVTSASKTKAVYLIPDSDLLVRPGPRILAGIRWLQSTLQRKRP